MRETRTQSRRPWRAVVAVAASAAACLAPLAAVAPAFAAPTAAVSSSFATVVEAGSATPERIVLNPPEHPDTAQSITWRTGSATTLGQVHIRKAGTSDWRVVEARANEELISDGVPTRTHSARIDGLTPATEYEYYVGTAADSSDTYSFTTAGKAGDPFQFIYFGDAQNDLTAKWAPVVKQAYETFPDAIGTVNAGDLVNTSGNDSEWTDWFNAMDGHSQTSNVIAAPGNHEYEGDAFLKNWKSNFEYSANGPQAQPATGTTDGEKQKAAYELQMQKVLAETAYYTDYQGVRFISLNASREQAGQLMTPDDLPPCLVGCPDPTQLWLDVQARWLDSILSNNPNKWAVAVFHQPVFSTAEGRDETDVRETWLPVFQRNDIDLVLMGHDHTYARGFVNSDATSTPGVTTGPVYAVSVSGPKYYEQQPVDDNVWTQNGATQVTRAGHTSTFQGITVTDDQITYQSVVAAKWDDEATTDKEIGDTLDSFTITKYDNGDKSYNGEKYVTEAGVAIPKEGTNPPVADTPVDEPETPEEPGSVPADVPLGHDVIGSVSGSTVAVPGPIALNTKSQVLYVGDQSADGEGTVQAIDLKTNTVLDQFDVGGPLQDLVYEPSLGGVVVAFDNGKIASYSTQPSTFGDPIISPIPLGMPVLSLAYDSGRGVTFIAVAGGTILTLDAESGSIVGQFQAGANLSSIKVDDTTGNMYVTYDNANAGEIGLRVYATRDSMAVLKEYPTDGGAHSLDVDTVNGVVYIGHRSTATGLSGLAAGSAEEGLTVVDLLADSVIREDADAFAVSVDGVAVDPQGLVYFSNAAKNPAISIAARHQAPTVLEGPVAQRVDDGATASFMAHAFAVPAATVTWEARAKGTSAWVPVAGATSEELDIVATKAQNGTQFRAVFSNTVGGQSYSTYSATATLHVNGADAEAPQNPADPTGTGEASGADQGTLAATGSEPFAPMLLGALLFAAGLIVALVRRRRNQHQG